MDVQGYGRFRVSGRGRRGQQACKNVSYVDRGAHLRRGPPVPNGRTDLSLKVDLEARLDQAAWQRERGAQPARSVCRVVRERRVRVQDVGEIERQPAPGASKPERFD